MALQRPFVTWDFERYPRHLTRHQASYYVITPGGLRQQIGRSTEQSTGHLVYKRDHSFVDAYHDQFPLGNVDQWDRSSDFIRWIESVIYYSFVRTSITAVPQCWFLKRLSSVHSPEQLPMGLQQFFPAENATNWIVIRHGNRVWPILVVGRLMFNYNWDEFCTVHHLAIGSRVVFACERKWVFNTFLFDQNGQQMTYDWTDPAEPLQELDPVPDNLRTACFPSLFDQRASLSRFLCEYTTENALQQMLTTFLSNYIHQLNLEVIVFKAANRTWTVHVMEDGALNDVRFFNFTTDLPLQPFNMILFGLCFDHTVRLIIFQSNDGSEKIARDWEFDQV